MSIYIVVTVNKLLYITATLCFYLIPKPYIAIIDKIPEKTISIF